MTHLLGKIKAIATKALDWLIGEDEGYQDAWIEYDANGRLICQPVYVPIGLEGQWIRCDRYGNAIPSNVPSRLF